MKEPKGKAVERFRGLTLGEDDRRELAAMKVGRKRLSARHWRRIRILELLDQRWTMQDTADATGTYPREVRRVARRFLSRSPRRGAERGPEAEAEQEVRCAGRGRRRCPDVQPATARTYTLDGEAAGAGSEEAGHRRLSGAKRQFVDCLRATH